ncbi:hypothetical protein IWW48_001938 [Coemansia sp. RSA 1200]|nr:hypothetical protein IWW48_001938 [Coemansia sp. RSA 1200]
MKVGTLNINLSEYALLSGSSRRYFLQESKLNCTLKLSIHVTQLSGPDSYQVPALDRSMVLTDLNDMIANEGNSRTAREASSMGNSLGSRQHSMNNNIRKTTNSGSSLLDYLPAAIVRGSRRTKGFETSKQRVFKRFNTHSAVLNRDARAVSKIHGKRTGHQLRLPKSHLQLKRYSTADSVPAFPYPRVHVPVLLEETIRYIAPRDGMTYLDATYGEGGYTKRILDSANCSVVAIDQDPSAVEKARQLSCLYPDRLSVEWEQFGNIPKLKRTFDGIVLDIGLSSSQLDSNRGFSFQRDAPLDMRMSYTPQHGALRRLIPANIIVNQFSREKLASIFSSYGQERFAGKIAFEIEKRREQVSIDTTQQLVEVVLAAVPAAYAQRAKIHPATRVFQALRIYINDELGQLQSALAAAIEMLNPGGRLVVVSFHSLEDSIVKKFFRSTSQQHERQHCMTGSTFNTDANDLAETSTNVFRIITKSPVTASTTEVEKNPRSRSAKLRVLERAA